MRKSIIEKVGLFLYILILLSPCLVFAENIDPDSNDSQYAYGENVGWINLEPGGNGGSGVEVSDTALTGYAWGENVGWIKFDPSNGGVTNDGNGNLTGYAWGENVGWINFAPGGGGVAIDPTTGVFSGYAYGENIGWINFAPSGRQIKTSWRPGGYTVWYVRTDGTDTSDCSGGQSWGMAFHSIHKAVTCASSGDEIWVKEGTYYVNNYIWVNKAVRIYGGFSGSESQKSLRKWWQYTTKVDAQSTSLCWDVSANATIDGFTITNCAGEYGGAMMIVTPSGSSIVTATVSNCIFSKNKAITAGGAIYIDNASPAIINCLFSDNNSVYYGGAVMNYQSSSKIINCTFSKNSSSFGGGIYNSSSMPALSVTNSILWGDTATNGQEIYYDTYVPSITYSDINQDGYTGNNNIRSDPLFATNFSLQGSSPCIDKGNSNVSGLPAFDLSGNNRIADGDKDGIAVIDMGAYEYQEGVSQVIKPPSGQQAFSYPPAQSPVMSTDPSLLAPLGVGSCATGGDTLSLQIALPRFTGPVDVYLALSAPALDPNNIYLILPDSSIQPLSTVGLVPWKASTIGPINESLFGDIPVNLLPVGTYTLYLVVTPANNFSDYYLWTTYFLSTGDNFMPLPAGQQVFSYPPTQSPVMSTDPSLLEPFSVGSCATGGDTLSLQVALPKFTGPVDVYLALSAPALDPNDIYLILPDMSIQPLSTVGLVPWKAGTQEAISESLFGDIPVNLLPIGIYTLYLVVTPTNNFTDYYLWTTYFENKGGQSPLVSNLVVPSSVCADEEFIIKYDYADPDGLADVKEHHIVMSDGYHGVYSAGGTGRFEVGGFFFSNPGSHWVKVYVVDFGGHQSNVLEAYLSVESCN
jgi:hypothetical protein